MLGCVAAVGLGLIIVVIAGLVLWLAYPGRLSSNRNTTNDSNSNQNSNSGDSRANSNLNAGSAAMSDDDKHKLFQAVSMTKDTDLMHRVWKKLGLMGEDDTPNDEYAGFVKDHVIWLFKNSDFIQSVNTEEKARAYVEAHIDD